MLDAHTPEGVSEANADEARDYASERSTILLAFPPSFNARPVNDWSDESLAEATAEIERVLRFRHPFAAGLLDAERLLGGGT